MILIDCFLSMSFVMDLTRDDRREYGHVDATPLIIDFCRFCAFESSLIAEWW